jgi:hypothetical protein
MADFKLRRLSMKRILFALAAVAILAIGGFALSTSAHADGAQGPSCTSDKC